MAEAGQPEYSFVAGSGSAASVRIVGHESKRLPGRPDARRRAPLPALHTLLAFLEVL